MNPVADALRSAAVVLMIPGAHCKGEIAHDAFCQSVGAFASDACSWCAVGSLIAASPNALVFSYAKLALARHLDREVAYFNDNPRTTPLNVAEAMWATADKLESA